MKLLSEKHWPGVLFAYIWFSVCKAAGVVHFTDEAGEDSHQVI
jgi:hypothetical protein